MDKDIRLYVYGNGTLLKSVRPMKHNYKSIEDCENAIENHKLNKYVRNPQYYQFLIVEYTGAFKSRIVKVVDKTYQPIEIKQE